ncbi:MAG: hypothetical protein ABWZ54_05635, partial [Luteibacter sp.]
RQNIDDRIFLLLGSNDRRQEDGVEGVKKDLKNLFAGDARQGVKRKGDRQSGACGNTTGKG